MCSFLGTRAFQQWGHSIWAGVVTRSLERKVCPQIFSKIKVSKKFRHKKQVVFGTTTENKEERVRE